MLCTLVVVLFSIGHVFPGCLRELKNATFCIIDVGCCPLLKCLEGSRNTLMNTLFVNFGALNFWFVYNLFFNLIKILKCLRKAIREDPETHDFVKRCVQLRRNEVKKIGFLGWPNQMCPDNLLNTWVLCIVYNKHFFKVLLINLYCYL
jgi:hypothetical protein